ncbi:MAG: NifU family protein [Deltaproteobacteria bacterium]|nr:NifU family protein [Deltaproteobacteria bacterium]
MLKITEKAQEKIRFYLKDRDPMQWGVRIKSAGGGFGFALEEFKVSSPSDQVIDADGIKVIADRTFAGKLQEAVVDFVETNAASGFKVTLPEVPRQNTTGFSGPDFSNPQVKKVHEILMNDINPAIASHGGMARLVDVKDNVVYLQFGGGCHGCGMVDVTLKQGIEKRIKELMPDIVAVVDETDHAKGTDPYFHA